MKNTLATIIIGLSLIASQLHGAEKKDEGFIIGQVRIEKAVEITIKRGETIAIMNLTDKRNVAGSLGDEGVSFRIGDGYRVLYKGEDKPDKERDFIYFWHTVPNVSKIIYMCGATGNWIPYSEENEKKILSALESLKTTTINALKKP